MNFQDFPEAIRSHFGNGSDFRDVTEEPRGHKEQRADHFPHFIATVVMDGASREVHLSNPYPNHWNAWTQPAPSTMVCGSTSSNDALQELATEIGSEESREEARHRETDDLLDSEMER